MRREAVLFDEPQAAAQSLKNPWTRLASTYRCIHVCLTPGALIIRPRPLVGWAIFMLGLDLHHEVPIERITAVERTGQWHDLGRVEVSFTTAGRSRTVRLYLKDAAAFVAQLQQLRSLLAR